MGFCSIDDVVNFLQVDVDYDDAAMLAAIEAATVGIQNYCNQLITLVEDDALVLDSAGYFKIFLPELPVVEVVSVVEDGETLTADDDYQLGQYGILYRMSGSVNVRWAAGIQVITVTYSHGYATVPDDVVEVCARAAARRYQAGLRAADTGGVPGVASKSLGDFAVGYGSEQSGGAGETMLGASAARLLLMSEKDILDKYRYRPA